MAAGTTPGNGWRHRCLLVLERCWHQRGCDLSGAGQQNGLQISCGAGRSVEAVQAAGATPVFGTEPRDRDTTPTNERAHLSRSVLPGEKIRGGLLWSVE